MNSLVVLLSVLALANAEPSGVIASAITYAAPAVIAPQAVSHQSRVDIKSTPAVVSSEVVLPEVRSVIPQAIIPQPAVIAPAAYAAPIAYSAPVAIAPAAVSTESRLDIKSTPAVVSTYGAPLIPQAVAALPLAYPSIYGAIPLAKSVLPAVAVAPVSDITVSKYYNGIPEVDVAKSTPVESETNAAPSQELPVAPTETPEVAAARAAHLEAKAYEEAHRIQKRAAVLPVISTYGAPGLPHYAAPLPLAYPAPVGRFAVPAAPYYRYF